MNAKQGKPPSVLILESAPVRRAVFLDLIPPQRFEVSFPRDNEDWGAALQSRSPNVVLLWQEDPERLAQTCSRLRSQSNAGQAAIVAVARGDSITEQVGLSAGADAVLTLPAGPEEVEETIRVAIATRSSAPPTQERPNPARLGEAAATITSPPTPPLQETRRPHSWDEFAERVDRLYLSIHRMNHYDILGVQPSATIPQIRAAFYDAAVDFHPDRYAQLQDRTLATKIYEIFKRISQAFEVLRDLGPRTEYDELLYDGRSAPDARPRRPQARKLVEMAEEALQAGELANARQQLILALSAEPGSKFIRDLIEQTERRLEGKPAHDAE